MVVWKMACLIICCVAVAWRRMRHLGKLRRMLVQHDNSGANPAWHLFKAVVTCAKDRSTTTFVCNDWIRSEVRLGLQLAGARMRGVGCLVCHQLLGLQGLRGPLSAAACPGVFVLPLEHVYCWLHCHPTPALASFNTACTATIVLCATGPQGVPKCGAVGRPAGAPAGHIPAGGGDE